MRLILTQCFPPVVGGVENLMEGMARALAAAGEVVVLADAVSGEYKTAQKVELPYRVRRFGGVKFWRRRKKAQVARHMIRQGEVREVFCDSWKSAEFLAPAAARIVVLAHGSEYPLSPSKRKKQRIVKALSASTRLLAVSRATRERMAGCGVEETRVTIWPPPIMPPPAPTPAESARMQSMWQDGAPRLLTVARLVKRKGVDTAIRAAAELSAQYPQIRHVIAGEGPCAEELRQLAGKSGKTVRLIGAVSEGEKSALYQSADVFVLPVRASGDDMEGFGMVFLEAGYYGLPAITGQCGGAAEAVQDGVSGLHCDGTNTAAVQAAIAKLLADESLRQRLGDNARRCAHSALWPVRAAELLE